jgi:3-dehydroquinate synthase
MQFLESLPDFHISSGYGEILKLYLTGGDWDLLENLQSALQSGLRTPNLRELIKTSLKIKKGIIERDEYESDLRRVLNYGHTFGHSLEKVTNHEIPHGLAVAWGMDLINFIAVKRNLLSERRFLEIREVIKNKLPFQLRSSVSPEDLIEGARKDKKTDKTGVNLIFLNDLGSLEIKKVSFDERLFQEISDYLKNHNVYAGR